MRNMDVDSQPHKYRPLAIFPSTPWLFQQSAAGFECKQFRRLDKHLKTCMSRVDQIILLLTPPNAAAARREWGR